MGRQLRDSRIESRDARLKLKQKHEPYWRLIHPGAHLGYRKGSNSSSWILRRLINDSKYTKEVMGQADDISDSDGKIILSYKEALQKAYILIETVEPNTKKITLADAVKSYLAWFKDSRKSYKATQSAINAHIMPVFGSRLITSLKTPEIKAWHQNLATQPRRKRTAKFEEQKYSPEALTEEQKRARKNTANRILTVLKAILNKAFQDELIHSDVVWRRVKPFADVDEPVIRFLTEYECIRLINVCDGGFKDLVNGALLTGCRYGELANLLVKNVSVRLKSIYISPSKKNKGRHIPLTQSGVEIFKSLIVGKIGSDHVFTKDNGSIWEKGNQCRLVAKACQNAKIEPRFTFHDLRHTYASFLAQRGADLLTISKLLGHADTRITARHYAHLCDRTLANAVNNLLPNFNNNISTFTSVLNCQIA